MGPMAEDRTVNATMDLCLRIGEMLLSSGAGAAASGQSLVADLEQALRGEPVQMECGSDARDPEGVRRLVAADGST